MDIIIRQVLPEDLDQVSQMEYRCFPLEEAGSKDQFQARIESYPKSFLLAQKDRDIIGYIHGGSSPTKSFGDELYQDLSYHREDNPYQLVLGLGVLEDYRGMGIGYQLMEAFIKLAKSRGKKSILLACKADKLGFYQGFSFKNTGASQSKLGSETWYDMVLDLD